MKPDLSIIVVSYNTREMTLECLRSVHEQTRDTSFELIVVDNDSRDASADAVARDFPDVRLIRPGRNLGFAAANNLAAERAEGEHLLLLNPDTVVLDRAVDRLLTFARQRPEAGIWGGRTLFADGSLNPASCWRRMSPWSLACSATGLSSVFRRSAIFNREAYAGWDRSGVREVDIVVGCFLLIRRDLWERLGGFDPAFFMYGEEADLCLRARAMGARPAVTSDATIVHHAGASDTVRADKLVRLLSAKTRLLRRHEPAWRREISAALLAAWPLSRAAAWSALALAGRPGARDRAGTWREIWRRRREWRTGYEPTDRDPSPSLA